MTISKIFTVLACCLCLTSCEEFIEVPDISEEQVILIAPSNGVKVVEESVNFNWERVIQANGYHLQIAYPNFTQAQQVISDTIIEVNNFQINLESNFYQWRVNAFNSAFETPFTTAAFEVLADSTKTTQP